MPPANVALDPSQQRLVDLPPGASAVVLGVSGAGKTTALVELVARRVGDGLDPAALIVVDG